MQATRGVKTLDFAGTKETVYERAGKLFKLRLESL